MPFTAGLTNEPWAAPGSELLSGRNECTSERAAERPSGWASSCYKEPVLNV